MIHKFILSFLFISITVLSQGATIDTITVHSTCMNKDIKSGVILPTGYSNDKSYSVIYLLHGYSGNYRDWTNKKTAALADQYQIIVICPDGGFSSWYFDSPMDKSSQYETYITKELIPHVDKNYRTIANSKGRGITGLSMGGHGALYLAFRHQDLFGTAGSMSGGVDIRPFPNGWDMFKLLGRYSEYPNNWEENTVVNMVHLLTPGSLALLFDCGTEDFFYKVNCQLHEKLVYMNIPHDFISRPGGHNGEYWDNSVRYHFLFMCDFFNAQRE